MTFYERIKHHFHAAGNGEGQPHYVPDLSASRDRTVAPCSHAVVLDAEALRELLPCQPCDFYEPLQPLRIVLREELRLSVLRPST